MSKQLRSPNDPIPVNQYYADLGIAMADPVTQDIIGEAQRDAAEKEARSDAHYQSQMRNNQEIQDEAAKIADLERMRQRPNATKQQLAAWEKQIEAQRAKIERLQERSKAAKAAPKNFVPRKHLSHLLKPMEKLGGDSHVLAVNDDLPKRFESVDPLTAIGIQLEHIAGLHGREAEIAKAKLPREDAHKRMHNAIRRKADGAKWVPLGEATVVRRHDSGEFYYGDIDLPQAAFWEAMIPSVVAHYADRIDAYYDQLEENFEVEFLSLEERRAEMRTLKAECDEAERILGALIRRAYRKGHTPPVPAWMNVANLFPLEKNPDFVPATNTGDLGHVSSSVGTKVN
jgi:hypothetical protein